MRAVTEVALHQKLDDVEAIKTASYPTGGTVEAAVNNAIATIGENMTIRRAAYLHVGSGVIAQYMHNAVSDGLGKLGVLVALESTGDAAALADLGMKIAQHIAAINPVALDSSSIDPETIAREKAVLAEKNGAGKPPHVVEKIVESGLKSYFMENCLVDQVSIHADHAGKTIGKVVEEAAGVGAPVALKGYVRYALGEGIEKETGDFAAEVAADGQGLKPIPDRRILPASRRRMRQSRDVVRTVAWRLGSKGPAWRSAHTSGSARQTEHAERDPTAWLPPAARFLIHDVKQRWATPKASPCFRRAASRAARCIEVHSDRRHLGPDAATSSRTFRRPPVRRPSRDGPARPVSGSEASRPTGCFDSVIGPRKPHAVNRGAGLSGTAACKVVEGNLVRLEKDLLQKSTVAPRRRPIDPHRLAVTAAVAEPRPLRRQGGLRGRGAPAARLPSRRRRSSSRSNSSSRMAQDAAVDLALAVKADQLGAAGRGGRRGGREMRDAAGIDRIGVVAQQRRRLGAQAVFVDQLRMQGALRADHRLHGRERGQGNSGTRAGLVHRVAFHLLVRADAQSADQWAERRALHEHGEQDHREGGEQDLIAGREILGQRESHGERHHAAHAGPSPRSAGRAIVLRQLRPRATREQARQRACHQHPDQA